MGHVSCRFSAPGSVMLMGEHAVLNGSRSICCAIDRRIRLSAEAQDERSISIRSGLGAFETSLDHPDPNPEFEFVVRAFANMADQLRCGVSVEIESDLPETVGLGSSAAVTVCACAAARKLSGMDCDPGLVMDQAIAVVRGVQGRASGADCAASALGGVLGYRMDPPEVCRIANRHPLALVYSGYKRKTAEVIDLVDDRHRIFPEGYNKLFELVNEVVGEGLQAFEDGDWDRLGFLIDFNHGLMESMGVCDAGLSAIVHALRGCKGVLGAKISGSGLGDCAVALGSVPENCVVAGEIIEIEIAEEGLLAC